MNVVSSSCKLSFERFILLPITNVPDIVSLPFFQTTKKQAMIIGYAHKRTSFSYWKNSDNYSKFYAHFKNVWKLKVKCQSSCKNISKSRTFIIFTFGGQHVTMRWEGILGKVMKKTSTPCYSNENNKDGLTLWLISACIWLSALFLLEEFLISDMFSCKSQVAILKIARSNLFILSCLDSFIKVK